MSDEKKPETVVIRDDSLIRRLAKVVQENGIGNQGAGPAHEELDRIRIDAGDEEHEAHVLLRAWQRAEHNFNGHAGDEKGNAKLQKEVVAAEKAIEAHPVAKARLEAIKKARKTGADVEF